MKKIILIAISLVLIIASMLNLPESVNPPVISGAGDGKNYNVKDISSFKEVMAYFMGEDVLRTTSDLDEEPSTETGRPTKHTSGTMSEESHATIYLRDEYVYDYNEFGTPFTYVNETTTTFVRSLTAYMDADTSRYISKGMVGTTFETSDPDGENHETTMVFDMEVLLDGDELYLLIKTFTMVKDGVHLVDFSKIIGKWVRFSDESMNEITSLVDSANKQSLLTVQKIINTGLGDMDQRGDTYFAKSSFYGKDDTEITLDLSDDNISSLGIDIYINEDGLTVTESHFLEFSHIDNTFIQHDLSDVMKISNEELEKMVGGI